MSTKGEKRQLATQKEKFKKRIFAILCFLALAIIVTIVIFNAIQQRGSRVYANGRNTVILQTNNRFRANLPHRVTINGTFSESIDNGTTIVSFTHNGRIVYGIITGSTLVIPAEWDDGCGHGRNYVLRS